LAEVNEEQLTGSSSQNPVFFLVVFSKREEALVSPFFMGCLFMSW
jgi:hypothetical protein